MAYQTTRTKNKEALESHATLFLVQFPPKRKKPRLLRFAQWTYIYYRRTLCVGGFLSAFFAFITRALIAVP